MRYITEDATGYLVENLALGIKKHFPFESDADRPKALADALTFRHSSMGKETAQELEDDRRKRSPYLPHVSSSGGPISVSGVVVEISDRGGSLLPRATFICLYRDEAGKYRKKSFGIRKHGFMGAFHMALTERAKYVNLSQEQIESTPLPVLTDDQYRMLQRLGVDIPKPVSN